MRCNHSFGESGMRKKEGQMHLDVDGNALGVVLQLKFNEASPFCSTRAFRSSCADSLLLSLAFLCTQLLITYFFPTGVQFQNKSHEKKISWLL